MKRFVIHGNEKGIDAIEDAIDKGLTKEIKRLNKINKKKRNKHKE